jgi:hypothetical protein
MQCLGAFLYVSELLSFIVSERVFTLDMLSFGKGIKDMHSAGVHLGKYGLMRV